MGNKLTKSPLTYVLAQVKISPILKIEDYLESLQEMIRKEFPNFKKIISQVIEMSGEKANIKQTKQWHFADKSSTAGILLNSDSIIFHTNHYEGFEKLSSKFMDILSKFNKKLKIQLCTRLGIRYINLIHHFVQQYVQKELLGLYQVFNSEYYAISKTIQKTKNGTIVVQAIHISDSVNQQEIYVPGDLKHTAEMLSFKKLEKNKMPQKDYVILDIDHFSQEQCDFDANLIIKKLDKLHNDAYEAFSSAVTKKALNAWK